ncbi:MAG TPA: serine/threonine-protein kinase [Myxococcota bacterium]|nr:serine/threonine-protein kinase [Myxococcota bacterium]
MATSFEPEAFGKYYLIDRIATGGMAEIFKAKSFSTAGFEKVQVIKRILSHLSDNEEFVTMFIDEAKISVSLQHSNLVQIYDFGKIRDNYFIAMEWIDGKDIKQALRKLAHRRKLLPEEFAVFIAHETCKGLDYAHKKTDLRGNPLAIIHRDMSPSNVLVSYSGEVKIADFGIAKAEMSQYDTKDGVLKGKFEYMSPEQARGDTVTQQSDLFSAGIILYEMLTGRRLFKTDSEIKTLEKIKAVDIKPPSSVNPNVPQRLDDIVMKALTADLDKRFRDARDFQQELLEYMYPSTPPTIQRSMAMFMEELFSEERADETERMEHGSNIAQELHSRAPELDLEPDWEEGTGGSGTGGTIQTQPPSRVPLAVAITVVLLLLGVVGWLATRTPEPVVPNVVEVEVLPTEGALKLRINTSALVLVGGQEAGTGNEVAVEHLEPGSITLRVEAEGFEPFEELVEVVAGERLVMPIKLTKTETETETTGGTRPPPATATSTSTIVFESTPAGADVYVDNSLIGKTPLEWTKGTGDHKVSYRLGGYDTASFSVSAPSEGSETVARTLKKKVAAKGKLNVNIAGGKVWGEIFVDGDKAGRTPMFNYELTSGDHTIRVKNDTIGLDKSQSVTVVASETTKVIFRVD